ncbi:MAG: ATP-binding protein, partial [Planctomycetes bacterium]|nr:ATP-binding protein [Planctomycetota bacterium]
MVKRKSWLEKIETSWQRRTVIWLSGVRRVGKTCLSQSLPNVEYFDCELPRVRQMMEDSEGFLDGLRGRRIVLDEIHRLPNPSEVLKIAADHYRDIHVLATGSSTLGASAKFKDTLTGRKAELWLTPMASADLRDFGHSDLDRRFLHGGLPPFFLSERQPDRDFQEWMDAYWAKDIQELFRLERRHSFQRFAELLMAQSGGLFEATSFARPCEVSRTTIANYLRALEATFVIHVLRPFSSQRAAEIISAPKVYAFDTGFVCYHRGWHQLRGEDRGMLWKHFVLNELQAGLQSRQVLYWRDKRGHEVDFVLAPRGAA